MHANAIDKITRHVEGCLRQCEVSDDWPQYESFDAHVDSLSNELLKHKGSWLSISDVYSIFYDVVYEATVEGRKPGDKRSGQLWDLLGEDGGHKLKDALVAFYDSVPRSYDVYVPLSATADPLPAVEFNDRFSIELFENAADVPGGYKGGLLGMFDRKLEPKVAYFRYRIEGYCSSSVENATIRKALSNFKIAFQQGISKKVFAIVAGDPSGFGSLGGFAQVPKVRLVSVDKTSGGSRVVNTELALDVSKLLQSLKLNSANEHVAEALQGKFLPVLLKEFFRLPSLLIENREKEAQRIKSAAQWCFDSYATENETMSFLQACFGLEALFGDETGGEALTSTLADRCAYLVATDIKGRTTIRERFKELYDVRSKLVHGSRTSLDPSQRGFLRWGRDILEYAIAKEIKHLKMT